MENIDYKDILHDFRKDVVGRKHAKIWKEWDFQNILFKTIAYELSASRDVESYEYVKAKAFNKYCQDYKNYRIADIMNGWWCCFTLIFDLNSGRHSENTKVFLEELKQKIQGKTDENELVDILVENYKKEKQLYATLLEFLKVVYTYGNIAPAKENKYRGRLDNWELKNGDYSCDEEEELCIGMYDKGRVVEDTNNIIKYMEERIDLILKRALAIEKCTDEKSLEMLRNQIKVLVE